MIQIANFPLFPNTLSIDTDTQSEATFVNGAAGGYFDDGFSSAAASYVLVGAPIGNDPNFNGSVGGHIGFRVEAAEGRVLNLSNLRVDLGNSSFGIQQNYTTTAYLRSSVDNFTSNIFSDSGESLSFFSQFRRFETPFSANYDLSAAAYQNLEEISFRLYTFDSGNFSNDVSLRATYVDNFILTGTNTELSAVPEASHFAMSTALVAIAFIMCRKYLRKRRA